MNRIAEDEPDVVGVVPKPISFWHKGRKYEAAVSSSATTPERIMREIGTMVYYNFTGGHGRGWIVDPCSMILHDSILESLNDRSTQAMADRAARRKARQAQAEEDARARATKTARW